jgi:hypothetical protein
MSTVDRYFEGIENPAPEVTENTVETARQLEMEVESQDVAEFMLWSPILSPSAIKIFWHLKSRGKKMCLKRYPSQTLKA